MSGKLKRMAKTKGTPRDDETQKITFESEALKITIEGQSSDFLGSDLVIAALQHLIENADLHGWEKHDDKSQDEFFIAMLRSITTVWKLEELTERYDNATYLEILQDIVIAYGDHAGLAEKVPDPPADEDDEVF